MNLESASSAKSLVDCIKYGTPTLQQLPVTSEQLVASSKQVYT